MSRFYVYLHLRMDTNQVFYIGKGLDRRAWSYKNRNPHWRHIVARHDYTVQIHTSGMAEADSFVLESKLIAEYRALGLSLANMTDGGDGVSGFRPTAAQRQRNSDAQKAISSTEAGRARILRMNQIRLSDPGIMAAAVRNRTATMRTQEYRARRSEIAKRIGGKAGAMDALQIARAAFWRNPDNIKARSEASKRQFATQKARDESAMRAGGRPFVCHQTGQTFLSQHSAAEALGVPNSCISMVLHGKQKRTKGLTFSFIETAAI